MGTGISGNNSDRFLEPLTYTAAYAYFVSGVFDFLSALVGQDPGPSTLDGIDVLKKAFASEKREFTYIQN
jgi:hypothetical protein